MFVPTSKRKRILKSIVIIFYGCVRITIRGAYIWIYIFCVYTVIYTYTAPINKLTPQTIIKMHNIGKLKDICVCIYIYSDIQLYDTLCAVIWQRP